MTTITDYFYLSTIIRKQYNERKHQLPQSKVIFTNGCFDVLHIGHVELLKYCASLGKVIVGLNSDLSVKKIKGPDRPINCEADRKRMLLAIKYVSDVYIFEEETPYKLIKTIKPDLIVKGGDYKNETIVGSDLYKAITFNFLDGYSTTNLISKIIGKGKSN